jgi:hypothetical protein
MVPTVKTIRKKNPMNNLKTTNLPSQDGTLLASKLHDRREIARARKVVKRGSRFRNSLTSEEAMDRYRSSIGKMPHLLCIELFREMAASAVRDKMTDVGIGVDTIRTVTSDTVEDTLSYLVEGHGIVDNAGTHQAFRKILDDLREAVGEIEDRQANLKTLSYGELLAYPKPADLLALSFTGHFDLSTFIRFSHINNFGVRFGEMTDAEIDDCGPGTAILDCWYLGALDVLDDTVSRGSCSIAQAAEAMGVDEVSLASAWEVYKADANMRGPSPTPGAFQSLAAVDLSKSVACLIEITRRRVTDRRNRRDRSNSFK